MSVSRYKIWLTLLLRICGAVIETCKSEKAACDELEKKGAGVA